MSGSSKETATLNTLLATLNDSINGYRDAAENAESGRFQELFQKLASDRSRVSESLRNRITALGGTPDNDGSFLGKTHQRFLDLKAAVMGRDDKAIINEVERGEDYLKDKFETALKEGDLSADSQSAVETAYQSVRTGNDQIRYLKHGMEA